MNTFVDAFLERCRENPERTAVMDLYGAETYGQLNRNSALAARKLLDACREMGTDVEALRRDGYNGVRVALLLPRTRDYVTALLAVARAGCAAVPLDAEYPEERIHGVIGDAGCRICITTEALAEKAGGVPLLIMEDILKDPEEAADESLNLSDPDIEGLLIFTSGSTGKPKGVVHRQSIFSCGLALLSPWHTFTDRDIIGSMAGFTFIASIHGLIPPLMTGGCVCIADEKERKSIDMLYKLIQKRQITGMYLPPQMFAVMRQMYGPLPLDYVLLAGEKVKGEYPDDHYLLESYGATETAGVLIRRIGQDEPGLLGKPGGGAWVQLEDDDGNIVTEPGKIGELCVASPWLADGYDNLPEETAARFRNCSPDKGGRMYHTGDYMAWDGNGNLFFHGRKDRMVKIRGYRIELGEIEHVIRRAEGVTEAACVAIKVSGGDKICCYYTGEEKERAELKAFAAEFLPEYMIPDYFVWMEKLPRNERNKVNYQELLAMEPPVEEGEYIPPETETEKRVCEAFGKALGLEKVSVTADFFDLGGTSLSVAVLIAALSDLRGGLSFQDVIQYPTPRALAAFLLKDTGAEQGRPEMNRDFYPLTKTQMGIYLEALTGGSDSTYSSPYLMKADPSLTAENLIRAVKTVVAAHPSMKYVIRAGADGIPHMFMTPEAEIMIPVVDGTAEERLDFMKRFMPVVPMTDQLLFHFAVYRTPERCYLALKSHLIFLDGTSISLIIAELNRALTGKPLLPEDYTIQQVGMHEEQLMRDGTHEEARLYHAELFKAMDDIPAIPGDRDGALTPGVSENLRYEPGTLTTERVKAFCEKNQITESSFFMGAMALMLGKYLNSKHVSFSTVYNGRALAGTENTIGTLIKRIPVYGNLSRDMGVGDYLRGISRQVFSSMSNDIFSFDEVLKSCPVNEDVEFIYQGDLFTDNMGTSAGETLVEGDKWFMEHYHTGMVTGCFSIQFFSTGGLYNMTIEYRNERFSPEWVRNFAEDLFIIAEGLMTEERIGAIAMLNDGDRRLLEKFNDTAVKMDFVPVHEQIHRRALETPDKPAVTAAGKTLTFRELDLLSSCLAGKLREKGVKTETLVGALFDREVWAYVGEIGILKAGGAFVPFIPDYPDERIDFCMKDGEIPLLLTTRKLREARAGLAGEGYEMVALEELFRVPELEEMSQSDCHTDSFPDTCRADSLAYCIYTSGTTGRPKGVMIEHRNIANYVHRNEKSLEIMHYAAPGRICLALASFSFDVSVVEEFVPLCNGNGVVIATEQEIHTPSDLAALIRETGATGITCTPTYLLSLLDIPETREAIRQLTFFDIGAEAFPAQLYERLRELREDSVILNVYGPTEATMGCAAEEMTSSRVVTVGPPIANTVFRVADPFGNGLPAGIRGELIICGDQVGRGYINLPDKTAASFFTLDGMRAYHSGDLAAWTEDGKIRIFGRVDNQIKLRGFRIELDEIEKVMTEYPGVKTGAAAVKKNNGAEYLIGYYTAQGSVAPEELKKHMQEKLPEYMVPTVLLKLEAMPMTSSGKVDKKALPQPDFSAFQAEYVAPETETEKALCRAFAAALKVPEEKLGVLDDFFELGGDSLKAMSVLAEAKLDGLTAADIFQKRTPQAIAQAAEERAGQGSLDEREEAARKTAHRLTPVQLQMVDNQLFRPGSTMWNNVHFLVRFDPEHTDAERLCEAVNKALQNHPSLSVAIRFNENNELIQEYIPGLLPEVKVKSIRRETAEQLSDVLVLPFHRIFNSCLCRTGVFRSPDHVYLFMDIHHLLLDGGSLNVLLEDIADAYMGRELKKDYYFATLAEEEKRIDSGSLEEDRAWFRNRFGDENWCKMLEADDEKGNINQARREQRLSFRKEQIQKAEAHWGVTHSVMAITAALMALSRTTGKQHVMVIWIFNNRLAPETEHAVGMLMKNLPVGIRMEEHKTLRSLLQEVKDQVAEGIAHNTYDFLAERYQSYQDECIEVDLQLEINGDELNVLKPTLIPLEDQFAASRYMLELDLLENEYGDGGFDLRMEYADGIFRKEKMKTFHELYIRILEGIVEMNEDI